MRRPLRHEFYHLYRIDRFYPDGKINLKDPACNIRDRVYMALVARAKNPTDRVLLTADLRTEIANELGITRRQMHNALNGLIKTTDITYLGMKSRDTEGMTA